MMEDSKAKSQKPRFRIAVFASGAGSNAQALITFFQDSELATVALIVCIFRKLYEQHQA